MSNEAESLEVEKVIRDCIGWALTKDRDRYARKALWQVCHRPDALFLHEGRMMAAKY
jgi:hypothetical protein